MTFLISLWILVWGVHLVSAGCKYTNPQWMLKDDEFKSGPEVFFAQSDGVPDNDQIKLTAKWNLSFVEKYSQCIDTIEVMVKKIKDPKTKKVILCSLARSAIQNCTGSLTKKDYCDETLDVWIRVINKDYKDGVQPIGAPSMTRIGTLECEKRDSLESLGDPMPSQSCESLQPLWRGNPDFVIPDGTKGKRFVNVTWTNHLITSVACVDEIEIKYWEDRVPSTYHKEIIKAADAGDEDHPYHVELDVSICKTYSYTLKAIKNDPYFVATNEGKFSSKCDDYLLNSLTTPTSKSSKSTTTTSTTSTSSEEISSAETTMDHETESIASTEAKDSTLGDAVTAATDDLEMKSTEADGASPQPEDNETTHEAVAETTNHGDEDGKVNGNLDNFDETSNSEEETEVDNSETLKKDEGEASTHHETDLTEATTTSEHSEDHSTLEMGSTATTEFEMLKNVTSEDPDNHNFTAESSRTSGERINVNIGLTKHGRSLMGQSESSEKDHARALELNPWGKSSSWTICSNAGFSFVIPVALVFQRFG